MAALRIWRKIRVLTNMLLPRANPAQPSERIASWGAIASCVKLPTCGYCGAPNAQCIRPRSARARGLAQEPRNLLGGVYVPLQEACSGNVVHLVAELVRQPHRGYQGFVVKSALRD